MRRTSCEVLFRKKGVGEIRGQRELCGEMYGRTKVSGGRASVVSKRNSVRVLTGTDAQIVRPYTGYTSAGSTTDARPSVPTAVTRPVLHDNAPPSDRSDSSDTSDSSDSSDTSDL